MLIVDQDHIIKWENVAIKTMSTHFSIVLKHQGLALVIDQVQHQRLTHQLQVPIVFLVILDMLMLLHVKTLIIVNSKVLLVEVLVLHSKMIASCLTQKNKKLL